MRDSGKTSSVINNHKYLLSTQCSVFNNIANKEKFDCKYLLPFG